MAKAIFERHSRQVSLDDAAPQRVGNPDPNRPNTGNKASEGVHLSGGRSLYWEDLSQEEQSRVETKFNEHIDKGLEIRAQKSGKPSQVVAAQSFRHPGAGWFSPRVATQSLGEVIPNPRKQDLSDGVHTYDPRREETVKTMADRVTATYRDMAPRQDLRLPGEEEQAAPGLEWFFDHHTHYVTTHPDAPHAAVVGSVMSPNNSPKAEKMATAGLLSAADSKVHLTPEVAAYLHESTNIPIPSDQIGSVVKTRELHPQHVAALVRDKAPSSATENWPSDARSLIRRAGTNASTGAAAAYTFDFNKEYPANIKDYVNPQSAPKVFGYAVANHNFVEDGRDMFRHRSTTPDKPYIKDGMISMGEFEMTPELAQDVLRTQYGHGTSSFDPEDRGVKEVMANIGKMVNPDKLHPATVQALAHPAVRQRNPHVANLALSSTNHPIVADSWVNAMTAGQPMATTIPLDKSGNPDYGARPRRTETATSVFKTGGEYFDNLSVGNPEGKNGSEKMFDAAPKGDLNARSLMHALEDKAVRLSAEQDGVPSVGRQASTWTLIRRYAGKDPVFNRHITG